MINPLPLTGESLLRRQVMKFVTALSAVCLENIFVTVNSPGLLEFMFVIKHSSLINLDSTVKILPRNHLW